MILLAVLCSSIVICIFILWYMYYKKNTIEHYENQNDYIMNRIKNTSTIIYSNKENFDDSSFYESYRKTINNSSEILIMDRCIELKSGAFDTISSMPTISYGKIKLEYSSFLDIQTAILKSLREIYDNKVYPYTDPFTGIIKGPVYVLITQYPVLRTVNDTCNVSTNVLNTYTNEVKDSTVYNPYNIKGNATTCNSTVLNLQTTYKLQCEICLLFPAGASKKMNITWTDIKNNMSFLLDTNLVINPRSQEDQCFVKCGTISADGYACGARNSINKMPYESIVASSLKNNKDGALFSDFANLYIINPQLVNNEEGIDILKDNIKRNTLSIPPAVIIPRKTLHDGNLLFSDINIIEPNSDRDRMNTAFSGINNLLNVLRVLADEAKTIADSTFQLLENAKLEKEIIINSQTSTDYTIAQASNKKIEDYYATSITNSTSINAKIAPANTSYANIITNSRAVAEAFPTEAYVLLASIKTQAEAYIKSINDLTDVVFKYSEDILLVKGSAKTSLTSLEAIIGYENKVLEKRININTINTSISNDNIITNIRTYANRVLATTSTKNTILSSYANAVDLMTTLSSRITFANAALEIAITNKNLAKTVLSATYLSQATATYNSMTEEQEKLKTLMANAKVVYDPLNLQQLIATYIASIKDNTEKAEQNRTLAENASNSTLAGPYAVLAEGQLNNVNAIISQSASAGLDLSQIPQPDAGIIAGYKTRVTTAATKARAAVVAKSANEAANIPVRTETIRANTVAAENQAANAANANKKSDATAHANNAQNNLNVINATVANSKTAGLDLLLLPAFQSDPIKSYIARANTAATNARNSANANQRTWEDGRRCGDKRNSSDCESYCESGRSTVWGNDTNDRHCGPIPSGQYCTIMGRSKCDTSFQNGCQNCASGGMGDRWFDGQCDAKCR